MAKIKPWILAGICASMGGVALADVTNLAQCVNAELTPALLAQIPSCDNSTPQTCLLGFIKGAATGDFRAFLWALSDERRMEEAGMSDLSLLTSAMTNDFLEFSMACGFSNHFILAYSEQQTNGAVRANVSIRSQYGSLVTTNELKANLQELDGGWRIIEWDADE